MPIIAFRITEANYPPDAGRGVDDLISPAEAADIPTAADYPVSPLLVTPGRTDNTACLN